MPTPLPFGDTLNCFGVIDQANQSLDNLLRRTPDVPWTISPTEDLAGVHIPPPPPVDGVMPPACTPYSRYEVKVEWQDQLLAKPARSTGTRTSRARGTRRP